ncbi:MAG: pyridoxine/pyridoxamine 5'-phosphate oxidase [Chitinophagales bacterium]|nr:MAG: pyridoxine/pyridoxamine 5'-phosphate oxidase [Chitinophagales bacterium]
MLSEETIEKNPFDQFEKWFNDVLKANFKEPTAVALATCSRDLKPSVRMVLMKDFSREGFVFYTNYMSRKGREIEENPKAALLFYWDILERQVRVEGLIEKVPDSVSDKYFDSRPRESRIGALASPQSQVIASREVLEQKVAELQKQFGDNEKIPRPPHWGGYVLSPRYFEFWESRPSRLHDRIAYVLSDKTWKIFRLAP